LLEIFNVFESTRNLYMFEGVTISSRQAHRKGTRKGQVDEPVTPEPGFTNLPIRMSQDIVSVYGDRRREIVQTIDKTEATCGKPHSAKTVRGNQRM
jgi:hypothetical protein